MTSHQQTLIDAVPDNQKQWFAKQFDDIALLRMVRTADLQLLSDASLVRAQVHLLKTWLKATRLKANADLEERRAAKRRLDSLEVEFRDLMRRLKEVPTVGGENLQRVQR